MVWGLVRFAGKREFDSDGYKTVLCYLLGITDPVGMELLFERFFLECGEWPDIDPDRLVAPAGAAIQRL